MLFINKGDIYQASSTFKIKFYGEALHDSQKYYSDGCNETGTIVHIILVVLVPGTDSLRRGLGTAAPDTVQGEYTEELILF